MQTLAKFAKNIQSQFGEDGVIEEIFKRIGTSFNIAVEFGAWDGIHLSNAWNLWHNHEWSTLLIEGDKEKYDLLVSNTKSFKNVHPHLAYVSPAGDNSLDAILRKLTYPKEFDLLSIDIDGDDYYIFESLNDYTPALILIEFNPTIPPSVDIVQKQGEYFGCSALALLRLAHKKGYSLAHVTDTNIFLVRDDLFGKLGFEEPFLKDIFVRKHLSYVISSYDGKGFLLGTPPYLNIDPVPSDIVFPGLISEHVNINAVIVNTPRGVDKPGSGTNPGSVEKVSLLKKVTRKLLK